MSKKMKQEHCLKAAEEEAKKKEVAAKTEETNRFHTQLAKAPKEIRDYYDKGLKRLKTGKSEDKQVFVKNVLQGDFEADFFKRLTTVKKEEITDTTEEWVSWKAITDKDGVGVVKAQIQQGTIMTRQHAKLNPDHPATQELPPEEQLQYKRVQEPPDRRLKF